VATNCIENTNHDVVPELTWKVLLHAGLAMQQPFQLSLRDTAERLYCNAIVRMIPGKRLVAFGNWGGKEVVAKLFYARGKAKRHLKCDALGIDELVQANVPTPRLLYQGSALDEHIQVLLFEKIVSAKNLEVIWQEQKHSDEFAMLMRQVIVELATQHVLGILQRDLHFKNFLVSGNKIYTLDGGSIEKNSGILDKAQSIDNLSLFFAQLGVGAERLQDDLFTVYAKSRGWLVKKADLNLLKKLIIHKKKMRWQRYRKKVIRTCTAFVKNTSWGKSSVYDREYQSPAFMEMLQDPEKTMTQPGFVLLKSGRSATVAKVMVDGRCLVIKRYNIKNHWHWLRRCLRKTRAAGSWQLAQRLRLFGVSTAKPVAYIENHFFGLRMKSYFIMEYVAGQNIGEFFSDCGKDKAYTASIASKIVDLFHQLSELKITHGDLKMTNILLEKDKPTLIDLDGMREYVTMSGLRKSFKAEIARFMKNWDNHPNASALFNQLLNN